MLKVGFVGIGSIAKRHIKNLVEICDLQKEEIQIDLYRSGQGGILPKNIEQVISNVYDIAFPVAEFYDAVFITNPTSLHYQTILYFQEHTRAFFIEKPVFDKLDLDFSRISGNNIFYVACPLRYTSVIQYLKSNIDVRKVYSVRAISSSYLPDWRPGVDYRTTYSAHKEMGGGVAIDLIHEWDYLTYLFGVPQRVMTMQKKVSALDINSDDIALYLAECNNTLIEIHLDYFGRKSIRQIELFTEDETILGDLIENEVTYLKANHKISFKQERNDYQKEELKYFLNLLYEDKQSENNLFHACKVLKLAKGETE